MRISNDFYVCLYVAEHFKADNLIKLITLHMMSMSPFFSLRVLSLSATDDRRRPSVCCAVHSADTEVGVCICRFYFNSLFTARVIGVKGSQSIICH